MSSPAYPPFRVLLSHERILGRVRELCRDLIAELGDEPPCLVTVVEGARPLAREVHRLLPGTHAAYEIGASSYSGTDSTGHVVVRGGDDIPCEGRDVVLIEDIVDTGRTVARLREYFAARGARSCRIFTLLDKPDRRLVEVHVDLTGFEIPDEFVLGFGMDLDGRYRELPDVVIYDAEVERAHAHATSE